MVDVKKLKAVLAENPGKEVVLILPDGDAVPEHFHVTEVGTLRKEFIDCGGTQRVTSCCQLQAWVATDLDHRISSDKLLSILNLGAKVLTGDFLPVEIEYEQGVISQYPLDGVEVEASQVELYLASKHTDCLAKEKCGIPEAEEDC
ncbi:DUF6428 family protein [Akkermansiaceae bacterium]|nr:DUF6428 family protein [Akkermansiaceae bacterium]MDB4412748.1 DUF6428 family protein [bacterium]MDA7862071.1 DUF6428 family protein [Akkermansiaceae bacterium]MDA7863362.1 DUF6428 family protein [Akkermansiaceae bacterium]MDA8876250.1 DUF6428 family protein [Akkermansiaceae bacterium]